MSRRIAAAAPIDKGATIIKQQSLIVKLEDDLEKLHKQLKYQTEEAERNERLWSEAREMMRAAVKNNEALTTRLDQIENGLRHELNAALDLLRIEKESYADLFGQLRMVERMGLIPPTKND